MGLASPQANASTSSLPGVSPTNANGPSNSSTVVSPNLQSPPSSALPPLKDQKFYKRAVTEDIEPTLRLDSAPGLSWLARRNIVGSMASGNLVVEPHPPVNKFYGPVFPCALCGERRKGDKYVRRHRFRVSEAEDAQRYPLCDYCLGRVRTSCDYIGFLRMVKDGHWRADSDEEIHQAYEESVRLRERMFWARLGGGVVPGLVVREPPKSPTSPPPRSGEDAREARPVESPAEDPFGSRKSEEGASAREGNEVSVEAPAESSPEQPTPSKPDDEQMQDVAAAQQLQDEHAHLSAGHNKSRTGSVGKLAARFEQRVWQKKDGSPTRAESEAVSPTPSDESIDSKTHGISVTIPGSFD